MDLCWKEVGSSETACFALLCCLGVGRRIRGWGSRSHQEGGFVQVNMYLP